MLNYDELYKKVKEHFIIYNKEKRFLHSLRVVEMALTLNDVHHLNINPELIKVAGLVHDYAKVYKEEDLKKLVLENFNDDLVNFPDVYHALVGDIIVKEKLEITDCDVLDSIKYHTTGKENMNDLTKIIYLADYIEVGRNFCEATRVRMIAMKNLDQAIYEMTKNTIDYLKSRGFAVYHKTYETYNYYKKESLHA